MVPAARFVSRYPLSPNPGIASTRYRCAHLTTLKIDSTAAHVHMSVSYHTLRRLIRLRRYSAKRISAEKRRNSGGPKTSVPKFGMGWSPHVPYDHLRSSWSHATCYMWCNAWANQGQPMGHGYGVYELFWCIVSDAMTCETQTNSKNSYVGGFVWELPIVSTLRTGKSTMFT